MLRKIFIALTLVWSSWALAAFSDQANSWNNFYAGDVNGAIEITKYRIDNGATENDKIHAAIALLEYCNYSNDAFCMQRGFEFLSEKASNSSTDERTKRWLKTELQNGLVANSPLSIHSTVSNFEKIPYFCILWNKCSSKNVSLIDKFWR